MNKKIINILYKWWLRVLYARLLLIGISLLCLSLTFLLTDYKMTNREDLNLFIIIICAVIGLAILIIGLFNKVETEYKIRNKLHVEDLE